MALTVERIVAGALMCALVAGCGSSDSESSSSSPTGAAATAVRDVTIAQPGALAFAMQAYVADESGIFAKYGLKPKYVTVVNGPPLVAAMISQDAFATVGVLPLAPAVQSGQDAKFTCGISNTLDRMVWVRNGLDVPGANAAGWQAPLRALKGRIIGVSALGSEMQVSFQAMLRAAGMSDDDVKFIAVGPAATALASLKSGKIDATVGYVGLNEQLQIERVGKPVLAHKDTPVFGEYHSAAWGAGAKLLRDQPQLAEDFCAAIADATAFIKDPANAEKVKAVIASKLSMSPELAGAVATGGFATTLDTATSVRGVDAAIKRATEAKLLKPGLRASDIIWSDAPQTP